MRGPVPSHVAIIMDGNRRYASKIGEPREKGHEYGADKMEEVLDWCYDLGVEKVTVYALSTENMGRSMDEIYHLLKVMRDKFEKICVDKRIHERGVRVRVIGDRYMLPEDLKNVMHKSEQLTKDYDGLSLNVAISYGGRAEIVTVIRKIARMVESGLISSEDISENLISSHFTNDHLPDVDLIIRAGGELRTSNFLPWQANGNESAAYFCAPFWPEFRKIDFLRAIRTHQEREAVASYEMLERVNKLMSLSQVS